jgi:hypothetical protein
MSDAKSNSWFEERAGEETHGSRSGGEEVREIDYVM